LSVEAERQTQRFASTVWLPVYGSVVTADRDVPRSWLVIVTVTPGSTPPLTSSTTPAMVPVWAG
jgi:hypothetical protein